MPPGPLKIRVVDPDGGPVRGLELGVSLRTEDSHWVVAREIAAAHVRTEADGTANVPWAPRAKLKYVDVDPVGAEWKFDETDIEHIADRVVTVHARRKIPTEGRLVMPAGVSPQGLLVTGFGFGPANVGDIPYARAQRRRLVQLARCFSPWICTGNRRSRVGKRLLVGPDTPEGHVEARRNHHVRAPCNSRHGSRDARTEPRSRRQRLGGSRGQHDNAMASFEREANAQPCRRSVPGCGPTATGWRTRGRAAENTTCAVSSGAWDEEQTIVVSSEKPVEVAFHRPWQGDRQLSGRLTSDGKLFETVAGTRGPRLDY